MKINAPLLVFFPLMLVLAGDVDAAAHQDLQNATGVCQPALPVFDGQIRKRPLAIANEGEASAFVSCSLNGEYGESSIGLQVLVGNQGANTATVSCTLVAGWEVSSIPPVYLSKSWALEPGKIGNLYFHDDAGYQNPLNLSCVLPPGTKITTIMRGWYDSPEP